MYAPSERLDTNRRETGSILILVLIVLSSMTALSVALAYRTRIELKLAESHAKRVQAHYLALGGIERIKALLSETELSPERMPIVCTFAAEAADEKLFEQVPEFAAAEGTTLAYFVRDEQGYLNVNRSDPAAWENLGVIEQDVLCGILDWIDGDDDAGPDGAETDFYSRLPSPYVAKNTPCVALKELLLVKEVGRALYLGEFLRHVGPSERGSRRPGNDGGNPQPGLLDVFTVYGDGTLNINTVSPAILEALPGFDAAAAESIMAWRAGPDGSLGTDDDGIAEGPEDLAEIEGLTELQAGLLPEYCCFQSRFFRVFCQARFDRRHTCCFLATICRDQEGPQVLYLEKLL